MQSAPYSGRCWIWPGARDQKGYGRIWVDGRLLGVHRVFYGLAHGCEVPPEMSVCHHCDNPLCINPEHLFLGTHKENMQDRDRKKRTAIGTRHGMSKLCESDVRAIRVRSANGESLARLGEAFGVSQTTIHSVVWRHTWRHIP